MGVWAQGTTAGAINRTVVTKMEQVRALVFPTLALTLFLTMAFHALQEGL